MSKSEKTVNPRAKLKYYDKIQGIAERIVPGGFDMSGNIARTYPEDISGEFLYISPQHLYQHHRGIDVHPTFEQLDQMLKGEKVVFSMDQWK